MTIENNEILLTKTDKIDYIQFKKLLDYPEIKHAYVLKNHDINFRLGTNQRNLEIVKENIKKICDALNVPIETVIRPDFNHTTNIDTVDFVDNSFEIPEISGKRFKDTDGLISNKPNITLMSTNADCGLILIYDPIKKVIGNVHAGWRGAFGQITKKAVEKIIKEYNSNPEDIICCLCPSIRKCHFEVDEDVRVLCENIFKYTNRLKEIIEIGEVKEGKQKYLIDVVLINKLLLQEAGVKESNIIDSGICSMCQSDIIHSRRVEGEYYGLGAAFIELG